MVCRIPRRHWVRIYADLILDDNFTPGDFKIRTDDDGEVVILDFYNPTAATFFSLKYIC